jgi:hypothetical protein
MIDVANRAHVQMRLRPLKFRLTHCSVTTSLDRMVCGRTPVTTKRLPEMEPLAMLKGPVRVSATASTPGPRKVATSRDSKPVNYRPRTGLRQLPGCPIQMDRAS